MNNLKSTINDKSINLRSLIRWVGGILSALTIVYFSNEIVSYQDKEKKSNEFCANYKYENKKLIKVQNGRFGFSTKVPHNWGNTSDPTNGDGYDYCDNICNICFHGSASRCGDNSDMYPLTNPSTDFLNGPSYRKIIKEAKQVYSETGETVLDSKVFKKNFFYTNKKNEKTETIYPVIQFITLDSMNNKIITWNVYSDTHCFTFCSICASESFNENLDFFQFLFSTIEFNEVTLAN